MEINVVAIRLAMVNKGMTLIHLAEKAHISRPTAWRYVTHGGKGSTPIFYKMGQALGVEPSSLVLIRQGIILGGDAND